ncbi:MAG TPA: YebC/PmpR family DNA-binding transcriptional regulator [Steroidobacteraceae bacterium]|nr:YebC/PmpR family DNA-binding transcriptional regulator [Steroidobacteraceae bacterium]
MAEHSKWANIQHRKRWRARKRRCEAARAGLTRLRLEAYGPSGAVIVIECLTADPRGTADDLRRMLARHGGRVGARGSVGYLFNEVGLMAYPPGTDGPRLTRVALAAGAEDVVSGADRSVEVLTDPIELGIVRSTLEGEGFAPDTAEVTERASMSVLLTGRAAEQMTELLGDLQDLDEVRDAYWNAEIPDEILARI